MPQRPDPRRTTFLMDQPQPAPDERHQVLHLREVVPADPAGVMALRDRLHDLASRSGFGERANDVTLAMAELIANAQEHGGAPIEVEAWGDGRLVMEVRDSGGGLDHREVYRRHPPSPHDHRGRGLWIVRQLMDVVVVRSGDDGTVIRVELSPEPHLGA